MGENGAGDRRPAPPPVGAGPRPGPAIGADRGVGEGVAEASSYTVRRGDTLGSISQRLLGDGSRWKEIARANDIDDPEKLSVGQRLTIPGRSGAAPTGRRDSTDRSANPGRDEGRTRDEVQIQDEDPSQPGDATNPMERESNDPMKRPGANPDLEPPSQPTVP